MGITPVRGTYPSVGLRPTTPLLLAGDRIEPDVSVPTATGAMRAETATPLPDELPPTSRPSPHALRTCPPCEEKPLGIPIVVKFAHSVRAVFPRITAPAARRRATRGASCAG